jgi:hypothetical protein
MCKKYTGTAEIVAVDCPSQTAKTATKFFYGEGNESITKYDPESSELEEYPIGKDEALINGFQIFCPGW